MIPAASAETVVIHRDGGYRHHFFHRDHFFHRPFFRHHDRTVVIRR